MAYNYNEEGIESSYNIHDWSNNVIISDTRMENIESGIVNLYNAIFGNEAENINGIIDYTDNIIGTRPIGNEDTIFDNIEKLWYNLTEEANTDNSRTPYGKIVDLQNDLAENGETYEKINTLQNDLGTKGNNNSAFNEINNLKSDLGTKGNNNSAFDEINTIKTNLGTLNTDSQTSAFGHIKSLETNLGSLETNLGTLNTDSETSAFGNIKSLKTNLGVLNESSASTAFGRIKSLETNLGQPSSGDTRTAFQRIKTLETDLENRVTSILDNSLRIPLSYQIANLLTEEKEYKIRLLDINYPIGSIYMSLNNADPKDILGGKWVPISQGRVLIGAGTNISDGTTTQSFEIGSTGGEYEHKLIIDEMPAHNHNVYFSYTKGTETGSALTRATKIKRKTASDVVINKGGNIGHNNIQPYLVCNIWQRIIEDIHDVMRAMDSGTYTHLFNEGNEVPLIIDDNTTIIMIIDEIDTENNYVYFRQKYIEGMEPCSNSAIDSNLAAFQNSIPDDIKLALVNSPTLPTETPLDGVEVWTSSNQGDTEAQYYLLPRICLKTIDMGVSSNIVDAEDNGHSF